MLRLKPNTNKDKTDDRAECCVAGRGAVQWPKPLEGSQMELMGGTEGRQVRRRDSRSRARHVCGPNQ